MERIVEITSTHNIDSVMDSSFVVNGKRRTLVSETQFIDRESTDLAAMNELTISFSRRASRKVLKYNVDENGEPLTEVDKAIKKVIENFYCLHPLTLINGKRHPNTTNGAVVYYDIIDVDKRTVSELKKWYNKLKVMNHLNEMDLAEMREVCFYYGEHPKGKTKGQLLIALADYNQGNLFKKDGEADKAEHFIATFIENQSPDRVVTVNCRKAIDFAVITKKVSEGGQEAFYLGNELLGTTFEDVVKFCKQNEEIYTKYILKGIREKDQYMEEEASSELEKNKIYDKAEVGTFMEIEMYRKEVLSLYDKVFGLVGKDICVKKAHIVNMGLPKLRSAYDFLVEQEKDSVKAIASA